jgi:hypothetical protein
MSAVAIVRIYGIDCCLKIVNYGYFARRENSLLHCLSSYLPTKFFDAFVVFSCFLALSAVYHYADIIPARIVMTSVFPTSFSGTPRRLANFFCQSRSRREASFFKHFPHLHTLHSATHSKAFRAALMYINSQLLSVHFSVLH